MGRENEHPLVVGRVLYELSYLLLLESERAGGDPALLQQAHEALTEVIASARQAKYFEGLAFSLNYAADVALARGEVEAALAASAECLELAERYPHQYYLHERFWYTHARALRAMGRAAAAEDYLRRAHRLITDIAESFTDPVLRQGWLENVRANRGVLAEMRGER
jgi:tetratricopeptide (TPR) repeat protein